MSTSAPSEICLVGAGPRGLSVLERLVANAPLLLPPGARLRVHVVDPDPGCGRVWRPEQSPYLLMNTVASQVTLFTDASVSMAGPVVPGPSLYEWARGGAEELGPDAYPTRALYGRYLRWVLQELLERCPEGLEIVLHRHRAVRLEEGQAVHLDDGRVLRALTAVVLAQGHLPVEPSAQDREFASFAERHGAVHVPPGNPADLGLGALAPGEPVLLRGLGLAFFDHLALLTEGRGGRFERKGGGLVYHRSGAEPRIVAGSRRGVPYSARGENQKGPSGRYEPVVLTPAVIRELRERGGLGFRDEVWPLVSQEVETAYYTTLLESWGEPEAAGRLRAVSARGPWTAAGRDRLLDASGVAAAHRWDWDAVARPCGQRTFRGPSEFTGWLLDHLRADVAKARAGNVRGPEKAALDVLRDLRNEVRQVVDHGLLAADSHRAELAGWYTPLNAHLSIGPPAGRIEEAVALIEAGVLTVLGPELTVRPDPATGLFTARSPRVAGSAVSARVLVEARLPEPDLTRTADPLLSGLLASGGCRTYSVGDFETGGLAVTERPYHVVDRDGVPHPRRFAFGVPTEGAHWATAAGVRPGVDSVILGDSDALARTVLTLPNRNS
ncbi:FAD/NAD(P)-binding protein [Streptomyces cinnabarinus]|uniref:FAD/NAD(P)-binding protein n=1 Tax=Streptomyces cinnabarinus TaxID=67287 RepID=A0ABY7KBC6_9ACTN|nr:FAD/NAD(P)-binding protein [Streptomyces cinnabarinus]WAZ21810.1 FAD/NAD(P)-binding protein [Streptomyces cinnabarinus]